MMVKGWILTRIDLKARVPLHKAKLFLLELVYVMKQIESTGIKMGFLPKGSV